jgi:hypothetical protein
MIGLLSVKISGLIAGLDHGILKKEMGSFVPF